jgi:hypothetical protein
MPFPSIEMWQALEQGRARSKANFALKLSCIIGSQGQLRRAAIKCPDSTVRRFAVLSRVQGLKVVGECE